ncbi:MAG TPA: helix-turn-helix domain-containing protein [Actinomycetota bacterium]
MAQPQQPHEVPPAPQAAAPEVYIRTAEAAKILRVSPKTVSRWAKEGKLPHVVTLGGHRRFPSSAIHQLADRLEML